MRILFAEVCLAIQKCIDIALLKDKVDCNAVQSSLREIYGVYIQKLLRFLEDVEDTEKLNIKVNFFLLQKNNQIDLEDSLSLYTLHFLTT